MGLIQQWGVWERVGILPDLRKACAKMVKIYGRNGGRELPEGREIQTYSVRDGVRVELPQGDGELHRHPPSSSSPSAHRIWLLLPRVWIRWREKPTLCASQFGLKKKEAMEDRKQGVQWKQISFVLTLLVLPRRPDRWYRIKINYGDNSENNHIVFNLRNP